MTDRPKLAALAVLPHEGRLLLAQRRNPPDALLWGYPGGHVDFGERSQDAAVRELREETGVIATPVDWLTNIEVITPEVPARHHFLLVAVLCRYVSGAPTAADDVMAAEWVPFDAVLSQSRPMSRHVDDVLRLALAHESLRNG